MLETTVQTIRSVLKGDSSLSPAERSRILAAIRTSLNQPSALATNPSEPRLIRRAEAARRLGCSLRLVDKLAKDGILPKRRLPNRKRAAGFLEGDLSALISSQPVSGNDEQQIL